MKMNITTDELRDQYVRATTNWPWIKTVENELGMAPFLLYALGSRETNLHNVLGDGGHGHGIWQRDDRSFDIPADYLTTPKKQAYDAGRLLVSHLTFFAASHPSPLRCAVAAYNAGRGGVNRALAAGKEPDSVTTGSDYGADVLERWSRMVRWGWEHV